MEARLAGLAEQIDRLEAERQARSRETTETKVELAKSEERLRNLHARLRQFEESRQERSRAIAEGREQLAECLAPGRAVAAGTSSAPSRKSPSSTSARRSFAAETVAARQPARGPPGSSGPS